MKALLECHLFLQSFHMILQVHPPQYFTVEMRFGIFQQQLQLEKTDIRVIKTKRSFFPTKTVILLQVIQLQSHSSQNTLLK